MGSQHIVAPAAEIVAAVDAAVGDRPTFDVHNTGIAPLGHGFVYDVHHGSDGVTPNAALVDLASAVDAAIAPLVTPAPNPTPHTFDADTFRAHLSLASHDLQQWPHLHREVEEHLRAIPATPPRSFPGNTVALYRTSSADWTGRWRRTLEWEHIRTWRLNS